MYDGTCITSSECFRGRKEFKVVVVLDPGVAQKMMDATTSNVRSPWAITLLSPHAVYETPCLVTNRILALQLYSSRIPA